MSENREPIPSMIYNAAVGGHVTNSQQIIDENENKEQSKINAEVKQILGQGGSVDSRIADAVNAEKTRAQAAEADRYTKRETYTKEEVHNLITTPSQEYVSVTATAETTTVTNLLPAIGSNNTTYRVGNWDGTQYNDSVFSEYAWNGSAYIKLSTKSQIGEVYDISENHANTKYADLSAALDGGNNIPQSLHKGGVSVKFVQSSDNKYAQYRLVSNKWSTHIKDWAILDEGVYVENFEFIYVKIDNKDKILYGVKKNGEFFFGAGCPQQIKNYIEEKISSIPLDDINAQIANKLDAEGLDHDALSTEQTVGSQQYIQVTIDDEDKILEGITPEGVKHINLHIDTPSATIKHLKNPEWIEAKTDIEGKILEGRRANGTKVEYCDIEYPNGIPNEIKGYVDDKTSKILTNSSIIVNFDIENKRIEIRSKLSDNYDIVNSMVWTDDNLYICNPCLNFGGTKVIDKKGNEYNVNGEADNISATGTEYGWIGANHGLYPLGIFTVTGHDKTFTDIGSKWTDGTNNVFLVRLEGTDKLCFIAAYTENDGIYNFGKLPEVGATLTHVSGATHTTNIVLEDMMQSQWYPSEDVVSRVFSLDGKELTDSGIYYGHQLDCIEVYDVYDPASYLDALVSRVGTFTKNPLPREYKSSIRRYLRYSNNYRFMKGGLNVLFIDWMALKKLNFSLFFPIDVKTMNQSAFANDVDLQYYLPKALPITLENGTYDFRIPKDFVVNDNIEWTEQYWENPLLPPDRAIEFVCDSTHKRIIGLHHGYTFNQGVASGTNRKDYMDYWWVYTSRASYNGAINGSKVGYDKQPYTHYGIVCYRKYEDYTDNPDGLISLSQFEVNGQYYVYADFEAEGTYEIKIPAEWCGKEFEIFEKSSNVELLCSLSTSPMIVKVTTARPMYGYLVMGINKNVNV